MPSGCVDRVRGPRIIPLPRRLEPGERSPADRARIIEAMAQVLPTPSYGCEGCHPEGGCPDPLGCQLELAERVLAVVDREDRR